jgi:hypothetical protein
MILFCDCFMRIMKKNILFTLFSIFNLIFISPLNSIQAQTIDNFDLSQKAEKANQVSSSIIEVTPAISDGPVTREFSYTQLTSGADSRITTSQGSITFEAGLASSTIFAVTWKSESGFKLVSDGNSAFVFEVEGCDLCSYSPVRLYLTVSDGKNSASAILPLIGAYQKRKVALLFNRFKVEQALGQKTSAPDFNSIKEIKLKLDTSQLNGLDLSLASLSVMCTINAGTSSSNPLTFCAPKVAQVKVTASPIIAPVIAPEATPAPTLSPTSSATPPSSPSPTATIKATATQISTLVAQNSPTQDANPLNCDFASISSIQKELDRAANRLISNFAKADPLAGMQNLLEKYELLKDSLFILPREANICSQGCSREKITNDYSQAFKEINKNGLDLIAGAAAHFADLKIEIPKELQPNIDGLTRMVSELKNKTDQGYFVCN